MVVRDEKAKLIEDQKNDNEGSITPWNEKLGFFFAGLLNNLSYCIILAGAKEISADSVGIIFIACVSPNIFVKGSLPYWAHYYSYKFRCAIVAVCFAIQFTVIASFVGVSLPLVIIAIVVGNAASCVGEASFLALATFYDNPRTCITFWSSGTGLSGVIGFGWYFIFTKGFGTTYAFSLLVANVFALLYYINFVYILGTPTLQREKVDNNDNENDGIITVENADTNMKSDASTINTAMANTMTTSNRDEDNYYTPLPDAVYDDNSDNNGLEIDEEYGVTRQINDTNSIESGPLGAASDGDGNGSGVNNSSSRSSRDINSSVDVVLTSTINDKSIEDAKEVEARMVTMTMSERLAYTLSLWPVMLPLSVVFAAEYAMQSGTWAAIGFPVDDKDARNDFYEYANWTYQIGVLVSRSSSSIFAMNLIQIQIIPIFQLFLLAFFIINAYMKLWYDWGLIALCFIVGLMGGAVYSHGFSYLSEHVEPSLKEFSLSAASLGDSVGVLVGDLCGIFIQKAIYDYHNLSDDDDGGRR